MQVSNEFRGLLTFQSFCIGMSTVYVDISSRYGFVYVWLECVPCFCVGESAVILLSSYCEINMKMS